MLHITNGDSAASVIREAGLEGVIVPWRDALHEGPVPAGMSPAELRHVRARFLADQRWALYDEALRDLSDRDGTLDGFATHEEVVLWFEHDLYDQLQLLQILDWLADQGAGRTRLSLVCGPEYLGTITPARLRELYPRRSTIKRAQLDLAKQAWAAFRAPDPTGIERLFVGDTVALPYLSAALRRHVEEFPSASNGLSRSESQALEAIAPAAMPLKNAFRKAHHDREDAIFLGDIVFVSYLCRMNRLVRFENGSTVAPPDPGERAQRYWERRLELTDEGRGVLRGELDWIVLGAPERWLGGVRLEAGRDTWRWDAERGRLMRMGNEP